MKRVAETSFGQTKPADEVVKPGRFLTKRTIVEIFDTLTGSIQTGTPYQSRLNPLPADPRCCRPPNP